MSKKILITGLILLAIAALAIDGFWLYARMMWKDETFGTAYVKDLTITNAKDKVYFMEINLLENKNKNPHAVELQEIKFNFYTDWTAQSIYSRAYQHIGDYSGQRGIAASSRLEMFGYAGQIFEGLTGVDTSLQVWKDEKHFDEKIKKDFYWYDGFDGEYWQRYENNIKRNEGMLIDINGDIFQLRLDQFQTRRVWSWTSIFNNKLYETRFENYGTFFEYIFKSLKSCTYKSKTFEVPFDLSGFFQLYRHEGQGVFKLYEADQQLLYITAKVHYEANGAILASQSILKCVQYNPSFNLTGADNTEFWNYGTQYRVTHHDFKLRYSASYSGYFLSLKDDVSLYLRNGKRLIVDAVVDLSEFQTVVGLDFDCFKDIEVRTLTVLGSGQFYLLSNSVPALETLQRNVGIQIINPGNVTYTEVII